MAQSQHYPNAPITEAIIDLRVNLAKGVDNASLDSLGPTVDAEYPDVDEMFDAVGQVAVGPSGGSASVHQKEVGFRRATQDKKQIVQSRVNGFTFSRLSPYDRWETFRDEGRRLWDAYRTVVNPDEIIRLAVRYLNRIDIPESVVDLDEYFRTSPKIAPELPQELEGFFLQLRLPCSEIMGTAVVNQTIVPPIREGVVSVVLDIDLFRTKELPQNESEIWEFFEVLHDCKNKFFEACITDSSRKLFQSCHS